MSTDRTNSSKEHVGLEPSAAAERNPWQRIRSWPRALCCEPIEHIGNGHVGPVPVAGLNFR